MKDIGIKTTEVARLQNEFKTEMWDKNGELDPDDSQDWFSMTLGWGIAKGLTPVQAHAFATHIRYETQFGRVE